MYGHSVDSSTVEGRGNAIADILSTLAACGCAVQDILYIWTAAVVNELIHKVTLEVLIKCYCDPQQN